MKSIVFNYLGPVLSTIFIAYMCYFPEKIIPMIPSIIGIFIKDNGKNKLSYKDYIPSIPKEPIKIWQLSQLEYTLREIEKTYAKDLKKKENFTEEIIKKAKEIIGTGKMNSEILHKFPEFLKDVDNNSFLSRVIGFFSFVNIIWMIAIIGIIISIGPSLLFLFKPFMKIMIKLFTEYIVPILIKLYECGFVEFLAYAISIMLISDGMKVNKEWGFFVSMTGTGFIILLFVYSIDVKKPGYRSEEEFREKTIFGVLATIVLFSLSVHFNSKLYSFLATMNFYTFLGFYTGCFGLCYVFGFLNKADMIRVVSTSFALITFYIILRIANINNKIIELYRSPIQIFGALTYFLGLLIVSSELYNYKTELSYSMRQIIYIVSLLLVLLFGNVFNMPSLTNTTYAFGVMYLMEKNIEIMSRINGGMWLIILVTSLSLWGLSLYLHKHSEIVISLFSGS